MIPTDPDPPASSTTHRARYAWPELLAIALAGITLLTPDPAAARPATTYRKPAYITNAYFSDKVVQKGEIMHPTSVVKALPAATEGVAGYFALDLVLTTAGTHQFKVEIIDQKGNLATRLGYAPVKAAKEDHPPMYTAVGSIAGKLTPGLWFFKVFDQLERKGWENLGTFGIQVMTPPKE